MTAARWALLGCALAALGSGCEGGRTEHTYVPRTGGDPRMGQKLISAYGCGACHLIPGVREARGVVGPPLSGIGRRTFIAGEFANTPDNLVRWLMDPRALAPRTAMPTLGLTRQQAQDVAAYLYTLD